jgi:large subunit ribosomal protein L4
LLGEHLLGFGSVIPQTPLFIARINHNLQPCQLLVRQLTTEPALNDISLDKGDYYVKPVSDVISKLETMYIEDSWASNHAPDVSETLGGITEEIEPESVASLLEQVENQYLAERRTRVIGTWVYCCATPRSDIAAAAPLAKPVYLTLSRLLHPIADAPPASDCVVQLDPTVFNHPIRRDIIHLCVVHYRDSLRQGSANTKTRGEVRGSGRKIRPQKGSGKARLGDAQSPMLRGGGVAFGPKPRDFSTKLPKKVIEMGMRVALSAKLKEQRLGVVESLDWPGLKTRELARRISSLGWHKTLFVTGKHEVPVRLLRSGRNIPNTDYTTVEQLKVYDVVYWPRVVLDGAAVDLLEARLSKLSPGFESRGLSA